MEDHKHRGITYYCNEKVVCKDCQPPEEERNNECFCRCHLILKLSCIACLIYHDIKERLETLKG